MKQRIPLTDHNKKILIERGMSAEELTIEYWIKLIINSEEQMNKVFRNPSNKDIQIKIRRRANKLRKHKIRMILQLPGMSGSIQKQKLYQKIIQEAGIVLL